MALTTNATISSLPTVRTASTTDQVFESLYSAVISLTLPPGTKLSEADIARQLGVSRQPVRDAFFRLSKLGFLQIRPQRATLITKISEEAVLEASFIRAALEVACLRGLIETASDAEIDALELMLAEQSRVIKAEQRAEFHALDDAFHQRLCEIAGHSYVWALIREQKAHMDRVRFLSLAFGAQSAYDDHRKILDALKARDIAVAEQQLREHLSRIRDIMAQIRSEHEQFFEEKDA